MWNCSISPLSVIYITLCVASASPSSSSSTTIQGCGSHFTTRLLNLTRLARYLRPSVEAQTHKEVTDNAILMNLSRLQRRVSPEPLTNDDALVLDRVTIQPGLASVTRLKSAASHRELDRLFERMQETGGFITLTEGIREITVILDAANLEFLLSLTKDKPRIVHRQLACVAVSFAERYLRVKGILHQLLQEVALQDINVVEVTSTATELSIFLQQADVQLAFDALYNRFGRR